MTTAASIVREDAVQIVGRLSGPMAALQDATQLPSAAVEAFNVGHDEEASGGLDGAPELPIHFKLGCWEPQVKVREGLARTLQSYRE